MNKSILYKQLKKKLNILSKITNITIQMKSSTKDGFYIIANKKYKIFIYLVNDTIYTKIQKSACTQELSNIFYNINEVYTFIIKTISYTMLKNSNIKIKYNKLIGNLSFYVDKNKCYYVLKSEKGVYQFMTDLKGESGEYYFLNIKTKKVYNDIIKNLSFYNIKNNNFLQIVKFFFINDCLYFDLNYLISKKLNNEIDYWYMNFIYNLPIEILEMFLDNLEYRIILSQHNLIDNSLIKLCEKYKDDSTFWEVLMMHQTISLSLYNLYKDKIIQTNLLKNFQPELYKQLKELKDI